MTEMSVAILAHLGDATAAALAGILRCRDRTSVILAYEPALAGASVVHTPSSGLPGRSGTAPPRQPDSLRLPDGNVINPETDVVLCRLSTVAPPRQQTRSDKDYARAEMFALVLSWLAGLGDAVINRPSPLGLAGAQPDIVRLHRLAGQVGLEVPRWQLSSNVARTSRDKRLMGRHWASGAVPVWYISGDRTADGPPLPRPGFFTEELRPLDPVRVLGSTAISAPADIEPAIVALAAAAGLDVAEVGLAKRVAGSPSRTAVPLITVMSPTPQLSGPEHLWSFAHYLEHRAATRRASRNAA
jgi:hypothetical protein